MSQLFNSLIIYPNIFAQILVGLEDVYYEKKKIFPFNSFASIAYPGNERMPKKYRDAWKPCATHRRPGLFFATNKNSCSRA